jgi:hypothetical protein
MLQLTNVFDQVKFTWVRLFNIIVVNVHLLAIVFELDKNFARFNVNATILRQSNCSTKSASMHEIDSLTTLIFNVSI